MKKLILSATLMAFAIAVQAGDAKTASAKEKAACCPSEKAALQTKAAGACPVSAQAKTTKVSNKAANTCSATATTSACSGATATSCKEMPTKQALLSPKAAADTTKRL